MSPLERRRVTLFDIMTLVAATAGGLALAHLVWPRNPAGLWTFTWPLLPDNLSGYPSKTWLLPVSERIAPFIPCLAAWTGAFLVTRLHGPRPRRRRLLIQPGLVAAVAALSTLMVESALLIGSAKIDGRFGWSSPSSLANFAANAVVLLTHHAGCAVAISWLTLFLIGRWCPERSWVDRWGRVLGCTWILLGPTASLLVDQSLWWGRFISP
jgi:hypothetical protein